MRQVLAVVARNCGTSISHFPSGHCATTRLLSSAGATEKHVPSSDAIDVLPCTHLWFGLCYGQPLQFLGMFFRIGRNETDKTNHTFVKVRNVSHPANIWQNHFRSCTENGADPTRETKRQPNVQPILNRRTKTVQRQTERWTEERDRRVLVRGDSNSRRPTPQGRHPCCGNGWNKALNADVIFREGRGSSHLLSHARNRICTRQGEEKCRQGAHGTNASWRTTRWLAP